MSRMLVVGVVVAILVSAPVPGGAQGQSTFDLDVPAGRFSFWELADVSAAVKLDAELEIREVRRDSQWLPAFSLALKNGERSTVLRFVREQGGNNITAKVVVNDSGKTVGEAAIDGWTPKKGERFQVSMDWSQVGALDISNGGVTRVRIPLDFQPQSLRVSVSTGELVGHRLSLVSR